MKRAISLLLCVGVAYATTGCASIVHGPTEQIGFTSEPTGAKLIVAGQTTTTPAFLILERRGKHVAHFSAESYEPSEVQINEGMSMWFLLGNLGFGGIPGWIIDAINGSMGDLSPDNIHVNMVPKSAE